MRNEDILREEIARGIEANRAKSVLQIHFDERREQLTQAFMTAPTERLADVRAALVELERLEAFLEDIANTGRMAEHQVELADRAARDRKLDRDSSLN